MALQLRTFESPLALELYVSATPDTSDAGAGGAGLAALIPEVAAAVRARGARLCQARVCTPTEAVGRCRHAWQAAFGTEPAVAVTWLKTGPGPGVGGIQVYAVRGPQDWQPLRHENTVAGWTFRLGDHRWALAGLPAQQLTRPALPRTGPPAPADRPTPPAPDRPGNAPEQTRACFAAAESLLGQAGMKLDSIARTWIFLDDILAWYGPFNQVRNRFFQDRGLLSAARVPASTGIGLSPADGARIALEVFAVDAPAPPAGPGGGIKRLVAAGRQRSAYEYGSAFARAAEAPTPAGRTLFVSGTAAIDAQGNSCFPGDATGQIKMTMDNMLAVLREAGYTPDQTIQTAVYCKTPEVAALFRAGPARELPWPWLLAVGDVCRPELLFEIEVTAGTPL